MAMEPHPLASVTTAENIQFLEEAYEKRTRCCSVACDQPIHPLSWDKTKILPCLHVLCSQQCLDNVKCQGKNGEGAVAVAGPSSVGHSCPKCGLPFEVAKLVEVQALGRAVYKRESYLLCTHCTLQNKAHFWCKECEDSLCGTCNSAHMHMRRSSTHVVAPITPELQFETSGDDDGALNCEDHLKTPGSKFCSTCDRVFCGDVGCDLKHRSHVVETIEAHLNSLSIDLKDTTQSLRDFVPTADALVDQVYEKQVQIFEAAVEPAYEKLHKDMRTIFKMLLDAEVSRWVEIQEDAIDLAFPLENHKDFIKSANVKAKTFLEVFGNNPALNKLDLFKNRVLLNKMMDKLKKDVDESKVIPTGVVGHVETERASDEARVVGVRVNHRSSSALKMSAIYKTLLSFLGLGGLTSEQLDILRARFDPYGADYMNGLKALGVNLDIEELQVQNVTTPEVETEVEVETETQQSPEDHNYSRTGMDIEIEGETTTVGQGQLPPEGVDGEKGEELIIPNGVAMVNAPKVSLGQEQKKITPGPSLKIKIAMSVMDTLKKNKEENLKKSKTAGEDEVSESNAVPVAVASTSNSNGQGPSHGDDKKSKTPTPVRQRRPTGKRPSTTVEPIDVPTKKANKVESQSEPLALAQTPASSGSETDQPTTTTELGKRSSRIQERKRRSEASEAPPTVVPVPSRTRSRHLSRKQLPEPEPSTCPHNGQNGNVESSSVGNGSNGTDDRDGGTMTEGAYESKCTICLDGGLASPLICCGKCPKVYHMTCHKPPVNRPSENWVCNFCRPLKGEEEEELSKG